MVILNSPAVSDYSRGGDNPSFGTGRDIAGIILWALGFIVESWADIAKVSRSKFPFHLDRIWVDVWATCIVLVQEQQPAKEPTMYRPGLGLV